MKYFLQVLLSIIAFVGLNSCTDENETATNNRFREVRISFADKTTRVGLTPSGYYGDMIAKWQDGDQIHVILSKESKVFDLGNVPVRNISEDGKTGVFQYALPEELDGEDYYELSCFTSNCQPKIKDGDIYYQASIVRQPIKDFKVRVMFNQMVIEENSFGIFSHYGTYEILHITNKSDKSISFSQNGFDADLRWYKESGAIRQFDKGFYTDLSYEKTDKSPTITIPANCSDMIVSWYIPNGQKIDNATLVAEIDGKDVKSSNTISSDVTLCTGIAYHMYATWDGKELKFDKSNELLDELGLGFTHLDMQEGGSYGFATGREGHIKLETTDPSVASAIETDDIGELHVDILAHSIGTAIITITDTRTGEKSQIEVVVTEAINFGALVHVGETEIVTMKNENGIYEAYSENPSIATCGVNGNKISVTGKKQGETIIHVTEKTSNKQYTIEVCVYGDSHGSAEMETFTVNGVSFNMVKVEGGSFMMGSTEGSSDEQPVHQVTLSSFCIGETEVTQELWQAVMGSNPSYFTGDGQLPAENMFWDDCQTFISKLNSLTGRQFRLPTEAEWEYAARGGSKSRGYKYSGSNDIGSVAWYDDNSSNKTHPVKTKAANELGIYDMSGNVWEWCSDWYGSYSSDSQTNPTGASSGSYRVLRGGCLGCSAWWCHSSRRYGITPSFRHSGFGLRLALSDGGTSLPMAYLTCPDDHHPHLIDLGLPSGTKWACCNVGASAPEQYGNYYAWGEIQPKAVYNWDTYQYYNDNTGIVNIGSDIGGNPNYDAATANWGAPWRMPSIAQMQELLDYTTSTWTTQNGVYGRVFIGPNGGGAFFPAAGLRFDSERDVGIFGYYWSSTPSDEDKACDLNIHTTFANLDGINPRYGGRSVRPVR